MSPAPPPVVMTGIGKWYGSVRALEDASLRLEAGRVHGVLGENGAGKTTLLEILAGHRPPDAGTMEVRGVRYRPRSARDAWARGIGMVHQHFTLVPRLSVLENLALGHRHRLGGFGPLRLPETRRGATELLERTGLSVPLDRPLEVLGVGDRQRVEILKVLLREPEVLVLDEPTAVLAPPEVERLLELLRRLAREGRAVVLVAHKLDEVLSVADRVTVLRAGRTVLEAPRDQVDSGLLARTMVGQAVARTSGREADGWKEGGREEPGQEGALEGAVEAEPAGTRQEGASRGSGNVVLALNGLRVDGSGGRPALVDVDLEVRRGEVVGVAGVEGNGQRELALIAAGRQQADRGHATVPADPGFIPQDRRREGLILDFDLAENLALGLQRDPALRRGPFLKWRTIRRRTGDLLRHFDIRGGSDRTPARALSGGNQQRVVVARELARSLDLLVAENPTRGLDVAAEAYVHRRILELREGRDPPGVLLLSTDLDEVLELSDRVFVMVRGRLLPVPDRERTRASVGARMLSGDA